MFSTIINKLFPCLSSGKIFFCKYQREKSSERISWVKLRSCYSVIFTFFFFYKNAHRAGFADLYPVRFLYKPLGFDTNSWNTILLCLLGIIGCQRKSKVGNVLVWGIVTLLLLSFSRSIYISLSALVFVLFVDLLGAEEKSRHIRLLLIFAFSLCAVVAFSIKR